MRHRASGEGDVEYVTLRVPKRIWRPREELFETKTHFCFERAQIGTYFHQRTEGQHPVLRRAKALRQLFAEMPFVHPE